MNVQADVCRVQRRSLAYSRAAVSGTALTHGARALLLILMIGESQSSSCSKISTACMCVCAASKHVQYAYQMF